MTYKNPVLKKNMVETKEREKPKMFQRQKNGVIPYVFILYMNQVDPSKTFPIISRQACWVPPMFDWT